MAPMSVAEPATARPREGWILAGTLDGRPARPELATDLGGIPYGLRLAADMALAGATDIFVVWNGESPPPDLGEIANDPRLASRARLHVVTEPPGGDASDPILVVRADRVFHRDTPKLVAHAFRAGATLSILEGRENDAAFTAPRAVAARLAEAASRAEGLDEAIAAVAADETVFVEPPYMNFTVAAPDARALRRAERMLVGSLRKAADGIAAKAINRHISLPITRLLCRTPVMPNHVTLVALACALAGGYVISRGGYTCGVLGMLLVELGSIIDGIDGELARLRFQFSRAGQWLDTVVDDIANVAYSSGVIASLYAAGQTWVLPVGVAAIIAFVMTQTTQYALIRFVYKSGDLAAIPWAFQSAEFLSQRPKGFLPWLKATLPKTLKRDFVVTMFFVFALLGRLEPILIVFAGGAFSFFFVFFVQLARNLDDVRRPR
jgi:1L-myo-inositol 1-phosphate cytidylyltransferase / CDP-L-myo-inositol myo-inositolphosphotransferase